MPGGGHESCPWDAMRDLGENWGAVLECWSPALRDARGAAGSWHWGMGGHEGTGKAQGSCPRDTRVSDLGPLLGALKFLTGFQSCRYSRSPAASGLGLEGSGGDTQHWDPSLGGNRGGTGTPLGELRRGHWVPRLGALG